MQRGSTFWGIILIVAGVLLLLNSLGLLPVNVWSVFWPLALVLVGLWILWGALGPRRSAVAEKQSIPLGGAARARVRLNHGAGRLHIAGGAATDMLIEGTFGGGLDFSTKQDGDELNVRMRVPVGAFPGPWMWGPGMALEWDFGLCDRVPIALEMETGASENFLDLSGLLVTDLHLKTGASSTLVMLPINARQTHVDIEVGAGRVELRVPPGVGAHIRVSGALSSVDVDTSRFPRSGDGYESTDYAAVPNRVDIRAEVGVGAVQVR
jgi:hypothetical protein